MKNLKMILLGKTGSGKSSFANMMFGEEVFDIIHTSNPGTSSCCKATREVNERNITLIDTPGFFDSRMSDEDLESEITKCITMCSPGPHAFLIFFKVERFTDQENEVISKIKECFSEEALKYAVVVFTHGDQLEEGKTIDEFIKGNQNLCDLLNKCGGRCCVVDNRYWENNPQDEYRNNQKQVEKLLDIIKEMVDKNKASFYTNEMLEAVEREIQAEEERLRSSRGGAQEMIRNEAEKNVSKSLQKVLGITTGMLLGALLGVPVMIAKVISALMKMKDPDGVAKTVGAVGAAATAAATAECVVSGVGLGVVVGLCATAGAAVGGSIGCEEADKADSVGETVKNTAKAVGEFAIQSFKEVRDNFQQKEENNESYKKLLQAPDEIFMVKPSI